MIISVPSVAVLPALFGPQGGLAIRFHRPMLFALAFLPLFGIGGLTGLPWASRSRIFTCTTPTTVIGHFHYVVVTGPWIALMAGVYHWFRNGFGPQECRHLGAIFTFGGTVVCMERDILPHADTGAGRRAAPPYDPTIQLHNQLTQALNIVSSFSAWYPFPLSDSFYMELLLQAYSG